MMSALLLNKFWQTIKFILFHYKMELRYQSTKYKIEINTIYKEAPRDPEHSASANIPARGNECVRCVSCLKLRTDEYT